MKALRLYGKNDIRLADVPVPEIGKDELLLKVEAAAICGSDVRMWQNGLDWVDGEHPLTLGHEFAGTIAEAGVHVSCYEKGMRVAVAPNIGCGICDACVSGDQHLCDTYQAFGINIDGAFAEYVRIPASAISRGNLMVLPEGVTPAEAALNEPLSCAYNGFLKCMVSPGDYGMVVGAGPIGIFHALLLKMAGAGKVVMNDLSAAYPGSSHIMVRTCRVLSGRSRADGAWMWLWWHVLFRRCSRLCCR